MKQIRGNATLRTSRSHSQSENASLGRRKWSQILSSELWTSQANHVRSWLKNRKSSIILGRTSAFLNNSPKKTRHFWIKSKPLQWSLQTTCATWRWTLPGTSQIMCNLLFKGGNPNSHYREIRKSSQNRILRASTADWVWVTKIQGACSSKTSKKWRRLMNCRIRWVFSALISVATIRSSSGPPTMWPFATTSISKNWKRKDPSAMISTRLTTPAGLRKRWLEGHDYIDTASSFFSSLTYWSRVHLYHWRYN